MSVVVPAADCSCRNNFQLAELVAVDTAARLSFQLADLLIELHQS